jgi:hypothetical protein
MKVTRRRGHYLRLRCRGRHFNSENSINRFAGSGDIIGLVLPAVTPGACVTARRSNIRMQAGALFAGPESIERALDCWQALDRNRRGADVSSTHSDIAYSSSLHYMSRMKRPIDGTPSGLSRKHKYHPGGAIVASGGVWTRSRFSVRSVIGNSAKRWSVLT